MPLRVDGRGAFRHVHGSGVGERVLDDLLRAFVTAFTEVVVPNAALGVRDVERWPVPVRERVPNGVVVVDRDRVRTRGSRADRRTLSTLCSMLNSGVCTPTTTKPCGPFVSAHARMYGSVLIQLMNV
jgi:hypothetical protein